jgi:hemolysin III
VPARPWTVAEEAANASVHGVGTALAIAGLVILLVRATAFDDAGHLAAALVFGIALVALYLSSTLHHAMPQGRLKTAFLVADHGGIYLLIAATYTPFCLLLPPGQGWAVFAAVWTGALAGIALQVHAFASGRGERYERIGYLLYLALAWVPVAWVGGSMFRSLEAAPMAYLVAGGLTYSAGVVFYLWRRLPFGHAVWHLFTVGGSALHFFAVLFSVMQPTA